MNALITFMNSLAGRALRVVLGLVLIGWGWLSLGGTVGIVVAVVGLLPLIMGLWGRCTLELFGGKSATTHGA